ncbi:hypothetical protein, partial [Mycobacterium interjectum]|uniref:hypothetical protein n=1 Tax=Mycobacterium interjectum TaxID=33895 RepID=UPI0021F2694B
MIKLTACAGTQYPGLKNGFCELPGYCGYGGAWGAWGAWLAGTGTGIGTGSSGTWIHCVVIGTVVVGVVDGAWAVGGGVVVGGGGGAVVIAVVTGGGGGCVVTGG